MVTNYKHVDGRNGKNNPFKANMGSNVGSYTMAMDRENNLNTIKPVMVLA